MCGDTLFFFGLCQTGKILDFFLEDGEEAVLRGILDKRLTLFQNSVQGGIAHEKTSLGFGFLEFQKALKIFIYTGQKIQIVSDILLVVEGIFCQQNGQLCLDA